MASWRDRKPENIGATFRPPNQDGQRIPWLVIGLAVSVVVNVVFLLGLFGIQDISQEQSTEIRSLQEANQDLREQNNSLRQELGEAKDELEAARSEISAMRMNLQDMQQRLEDSGP